MAKTKVAFEVFLPTTSMNRVNDFVVKVLDAAVKEHRGEFPHVVISGPYHDNFVPENLRGTNEAPGSSEHGSGRGNAGGGRADGGGRVERSARDEADERARADFEDGEGAGDAPGPAAPAEPAKRGRGRPRKSDAGSAEASGTAAGSEQRNQRAEGSGSPAEGNRGNVAGRTDEGAGQGRGEGQGGSRGAGSDRGNQQRNAEAPRVASPDDWNDDGPDANVEEGPDWWCKTPGDEWPDHLTPENVDETVLAQLLAKHFEACGDRQKTYAVMQEATKERTLKNVHPDDFDKLARALLKDAARIQFGVKR
jgi:hypothetical protein